MGKLTIYFVGCFVININVELKKRQDNMNIKVWMKVVVLAKELELYTYILYFDDSYYGCNKQ